jgi:hypothetical protein
MTRQNCKLTNFNIRRQFRHMGIVGQESSILDLD